MTLFSTNMKKYRLQQGLTQEQVAETLKVNPQTVSRWECGTTMPDVLALPEIARLYAVTIDDLFKSGNSAYRNYADRLAAVYEKTKSVDDFYAAEAEYRKMIRTGKMDIWDKWGYANLLDEMRTYCTGQAIKWYENILKEDGSEEPYVYSRVRSLYSGLMIDIGKGNAVIEKQESIVKKNPANAKEIGFLMELYCRTGDYSKVIELYSDTQHRNISDWTIYYFVAEAKRFTGKYSEAVTLYEKCGELGTDFHDEIEALAFCYEEMGDKEKAYEKYMEMSRLLRSEGYEEDAEAYEKMAEELNK